MPKHSVKLTIVYNNVAHDNRMTTDWGMACLIEGFGKTILFDTGANGEVLLHNMRTLDKNPKQVDIVVLSHKHADHTGGLTAFLKANSNVEVFIPRSFPGTIEKNIKATGAEVVLVGDRQKIAPHFYTTGPMGTMITEQALAVETREGIVLVTGCSHPGVANIAEEASKMFPAQPFYLVTGGFHLGGHTRGQIRRIIERLRSLNIRNIGPSHCTGNQAMEMFRKAWADDFLELGCGAQLTISAE